MLRLFLSWWMCTDGLQHTSAAELWFMHTPATCSKLHARSFTKELVHAVMKTLENRTALKQLSASIPLTPSGCFNSLSNAGLQTKTATLQSRNIKYLWSNIMVYLKLFFTELQDYWFNIAPRLWTGISGFKCTISNFVLIHNLCFINCSIEMSRKSFWNYVIDGKVFLLESWTLLQQKIVPISAFFYLSLRH